MSEGERGQINIIGVHGTGEEQEDEGFMVSFQLLLPMDQSTTSSNNQRVGSLRPMPHRSVNQRNNHMSSDQIIEMIQENAQLIAAMAFHRYIQSLLPNGQHLQGQPPASKAVIDALPVLTAISEKRQVKHGKCCSVCLEEFMPVSEPGSTLSSQPASSSSSEPIPTPQSIVRMPCHHIFHQGCLNTWLEHSATCPLCKYELDTDNDEYNEAIRERMKERDEKLALEPDTDSECDNDEPECNTRKDDTLLPLAAAQSIESMDSVQESGESSQQQITSRRYPLRNRKRVAAVGDDLENQESSVTTRPVKKLRRNQKKT